MAARPQTAWQQAFEALADAPIPCHELDLEGRVVRVNPAGCRLLGLPEAEIVGHPVWQFVAPEEQALVRERLGRNLSSEQPLDSQERNWIRPDGARLVLEIHSNYIRDPEGRIRGIRTFLLDVTRRKVIPPGTAFEDLLVPAWRDGKQVYSPPPLSELRARTQGQLALLHPGLKRFVNPHTYPVGLDPLLHERRVRMILQARAA